MQQNSKKIRTVVQILERVGDDLFFVKIREFQNKLLLELTKDTPEGRLKDLEMELLKKDSRYSINGIARQIGLFVFEKGIEPNDIYKNIKQ